MAVCQFASSRAATAESVSTWCRRTMSRSRTGSPVAHRVLDAWQELLPRFVKVFPTDYKRVLAEQAAASTAEEVAA